TGPTEASNFTIKVTDGNTPPQSATQALSIAVNSAATLTITTTALVSGSENATYSAMLQSKGGVAPINWSVTGGRSLPAGLSLNSSTGAITGTPTVSGVFDMTFQAADSSLPQQTTTATLSLTIAALSITTTSLLNPMVG